MGHKRGLTALTIVLAGAVLAVSACGSSGGTGGGAGSGTAAGTAAGGQSSGGQEVAKLSTTASPSLVTLYTNLGMTEGIFKKNGLDVTAEKSNGSQAQGVSLLLGGHLDFITATPSTIVPLIARGQKFVFLAGGSGMNYDLIARPGLSLPHKNDPFPQNVLDVKGKTIGITGTGTTTDQFAQEIMKAAGLKPSDATLVAVGGTATGVPAFTSGKVDFLVTVAPEEQIIGKDKFQMVVDLVGGKANGLFKDFMAAGFVVTQAEIDKHPDVVKRLCDSVWAVSDYAQDPANLNAVAKYISESNHLTIAQATEAWERYASSYDMQITKARWQEQAQYLPEGVKLPPYETSVNQSCANRTS